MISSRRIREVEFGCHAQDAARDQDDLTDDKLDQCWPFLAWGLDGLGEGRG